MPESTTTKPIIQQSDLEALCERVAKSPLIGIDTEFVSEHTFYPELCLIQVATADEMAVIDPQEVDVMPFWEMLTEGKHTTILHAGREEFNFILRAVGKLPHDVFDVQIAAGLCSNEYPGAYGSVVNRFLNHKPRKGEQRTDWRKRPLTDAQIDYALEDVRYLLSLREKLIELLESRNRLSWFEAEMASWSQKVVDAQDRRDWRRTSGIGKLNSTGLAIVRELWNWRHEEAKQLDQPQKRILRDDLMVEIANRKTDNPERILGIRGLQKGLLKRKVDELAACVRRGIESPEKRNSKGRRRELPSQLNLLGQFLTPAMTTICRKAEVAASMVGTASDFREFIAHRMGYAEGDEMPKLSQGWRGELVGNLIDDLLNGKKSIRIENLRDEDPLVFDEHVG
ncbi:ribonuclease D [Adhaeretor mobilis]|uniref:Ribonuclease D n=1 Tax=Adhaeretor mobilis TaxID=1930276 RepID=A0A517MY24_9BACT|nr:HRDC domain-containing protein [Adhaeretor mobilis]QDS99780.1 Ribonuclease D [Adhaeretor mobilis]